jgi:hypothetical protein
MRRTSRALLVVVAAVGVAGGFLLGRSHPQPDSVTVVRTARAADPTSLTAHIPVAVLSKLKRLTTPDPAAGSDQILPSYGSLWIRDTSSGAVQAVICDDINGTAVVTYAQSGKSLSYRVFPTVQEVLDAQSAGDHTLDPPPEIFNLLLLACP